MAYNNLYPDPETDPRPPTEEDFNFLLNLEDLYYDETKEENLDDF